MSEQDWPEGCIDCGVKSSGWRCRRCNGRFIALTAARERADADRALLADRAAGLTLERIATREGISRAGAGKRVRAAVRRQKLLT